MSEAAIATVQTPPPPPAAAAARATEGATVPPGGEAAAFLLQLLALGVAPTEPSAAAAQAAGFGPRPGQGLPPLAPPGAGPRGPHAGPAPDAADGSADASDATRAMAARLASAMASGGTGDPDHPLNALVAATVVAEDTSAGGADATAPAARGAARAEGLPVPALQHHPGAQPVVHDARPAGHAALPAGPAVLADTGPGAAQVLAEHVVWQAGRGIESAELRIRPAELGPLLVQVQVADGEARVHFVAAHSATRDLIADALPRLGQLLDAAGVQLSDASVASQHQGGGQPPPSPWLDAYALERTPAAGAAETVDPVTAPRRGSALVDLFA